MVRATVCQSTVQALRGRGSGFIHVPGANIGFNLQLIEINEKNCQRLSDLNGRKLDNRKLVVYCIAAFLMQAG